MDILHAVLATFQKKQLKSILKTKDSKTDPKGSLFPLFFYEISRTTTVAQLKTYGFILVRDDNSDRKSPYVEYVGSANVQKDFVPDAYFRKWDCPLLHMMTYPCIRRIIEHIGNITVENVFKVAPSYSDFVEYGSL